VWTQFSAGGQPKLAFWIRRMGESTAAGAEVVTQLVQEPPRFPHWRHGRWRRGLRGPINHSFPSGRKRVLAAVDWPQSIVRLRDMIRMKRLGSLTVAVKTLPPLLRGPASRKPWRLFIP